MATHKMPKRVVIGIDFSYTARTRRRKSRDVALLARIIVDVSMFQKILQCVMRTSRRGDMDESGLLSKMCMGAHFALLVALHTSSKFLRCGVIRYGMCD